MEDKKIAEHQNIPRAKTEKEVDQDASKLIRECDVDVGMILPPSAMENKKITEHQNIPGAKTEEVDQDANKLIRECDVDVGMILPPYAMEDKKIAEHQNIPGAKTKKEVDRDASNLIPECDVDVGMIHPPSESNQTTQLANLHVRDTIKQSYDELALREEAANSRIPTLDQINETRQKGWWKSIDKFSADDITKYEAWLDCATFMLNRHLKKLENEATSSLPSRGDK